MQKTKRKGQIRHGIIRRSERLKASTKIADSIHPKSCVSSKPHSKIKYGDRLMPIISPSRKLQISHHIKSPPLSDDNDYNGLLSYASGVRSLPLVLKYASPISSPSMHYRPLRDLHKLDPSSFLKLPLKNPEIIRKFSPDRILDAPGLTNDRTVSMMDCSTIGVVAVVLNNTVYLWRENNDETKILLQLDASDSISCIRFSSSGRKLAVGTKSGKITLHHFDVSGFNEVKSCSSHIFGLDLKLEFEGDDVLWIGSSDGSLIIYSIKKEGNRKCLSEKQNLLGTPHSSAIVRIRSSTDYIAVGEIRGLVSLWRHKTLIRLISHPSPIVDFAWGLCFPDILAIAGGKTVNFYSVFKGKITGQINTENEVCNILWSSETSEILISTDSTDEHLTLCSYPELKIQKCWNGHDCTPSFLGLSGGGTTLVSAAPDEFIKVSIFGLI